jgi:hypothetical protein
VYIHVRDSLGNEKYIEESGLEQGIASGEIVAFRRSDGWITVPDESRRGKSDGSNGYSGQERRRAMLGRKRVFTES